MATKEESPLVTTVRQHAVVVEGQLATAVQALEKMAPWIESEIAAKRFDQPRQEAAKLVALAGRLEKTVEEKKQASTAPLTKLLNEVRAVWTSVTDGAKAMKSSANALLIKVQRADEAHRYELEQEALRRARELEAAKAKLVAEAPSVQSVQPQAVAIQREIVSTLTAIPEAAPTTTKTADGVSASVGKGLDFEVTDIAALAAAYPDAVEVRRSAVLKLLREGVDVPGVKKLEPDKVRATGIKTT